MIWWTGWTFSINYVAEKDLSKKIFYIDLTNIVYKGTITAAPWTSDEKMITLLFSLFEGNF